MRFYRCSQRSYSISPIILRQLPLRSPVKIMIIWWLTKQIKIPKKVGTFLKKYPLWSPVLLKSQSNINEAGHRRWHFPWTFSIFLENSVCRVHGNCDAFLVFDREALLHSISEPAKSRNPEEQSLWKLPEKKSVGKVPS